MVKVMWLGDVVVCFGVDEFVVVLCKGEGWDVRSVFWEFLLVFCKLVEIDYVWFLVFMMVGFVIFLVYGYDV